MSCPCKDTTRQPIRFLWFEIDRKTDILAFLAFIISLFAVGYQIVTYFSGPNIKPFPSDQVVIYERKLALYTAAAVQPTALTEFATLLSYANVADTGNNGVVNDQRVVLKLDHEYEYEWASVVKYGDVTASTGQKAACDGDAICFSGFRIQRTESAGPFPVNAGSAITKVFSFDPVIVRCANQATGCSATSNGIGFDDLLKALDGMRQRHEALVFDFVTHRLDASNKNARCAVDVDEALIRHLREERWASPTCWPLSG